MSIPNLQNPVRATLNRMQEEDERKPVTQPQGGSVGYSMIFTEGYVSVIKGQTGHASQHIRATAIRN